MSMDVGQNMKMDLW